MDHCACAVLLANPQVGVNREVTPGVNEKVKIPVIIWIETHFKSILKYIVLELIWIVDPSDLMWFALTKNGSEPFYELLTNDVDLNLFELQ